MTDIVLGIRLTADGKELVGGVHVSEEALKKLREEVGRNTGEAAKLNQQQQSLASTMWASAKAIGAVAIAYQGLSIIKDYIKDAALLNARHEELGVALAVVGRNAGYSRSEMFAAAEAVQKLGVTMNGSREAVARLVLAQIDLADATKLADVARNVAVIGMVNTTEAFERLVQGIQTGQHETLKTLGINVNFEESYKKLAAQLKVTTEQLTEQEKTQARSNAVILDGARSLTLYDEAMTTASKQLRSLARYEEDLKNIRGEVFNEALIIAVTRYTDSLKGATDEAKRLQEQGDLKQWGRDMIEILAFVADAAIGVRNVFKLAQIGMAEWMKEAETAFKVFTLSGGGNLSLMVLNQDKIAQVMRERLAFMQESEGDQERLLMQPTFRQQAQDVFAAKDQAAAAKALKDQNDELDDLFMGADRAGAGTRPGGRGGAAGSDLAEYVARLKEQVDITKESTIEEKVLFELREKHWKNATPALQQQAIEYAKQLDLRKQEAEANRQAAAEIDRKNSIQTRADAVLATFNQTQSEALQQIKFETELIGMNDVAREKAIALRKLEQDWQKSSIKLEGEEADAYARRLATTKAFYEQARRDIPAAIDLRGDAERANQALKGTEAAAKKAAEESQRAWQQTSDNIERSLVDSIMRGWERGESFLKNGWNALKNWFLTTAITIPVRFISQGITGALAGLGIPGVANAAGGAGNLLSLGSSASNLFGGLGSSIFGGAGAYSLLGFGGEQAAMLAAQTGVFGLEGLSATAGAAGLGGASMALSAIPYVGAALAIAGLLGAFGGSGKTPTRAIGHFTGAYGPSGLVSGSGPDPYGGDASAAQRVTDELYRRFDAAAAALGAAYTSASFGYGANTGRNSQNPNFALSASVGGRSYQVGENVGSFRTLDDATLQLEISRGLLSALQGSELPQYLRKYFDSLVSASMDKTAIDNALAFAGSLKAIRDQLTGTARDPFELLGENMGKMFADLSTSAARWRDDFASAIDAGLTPESLGRWQALSAAVAQTAQFAAPLLTRMGAAIQLQDATRDLFLSDLSPLTMAQRLAEAQGRYGSTLDLARSGDQAALAQLSGLSRTYLTEARGYYASSPDYTAIFGQVQTEIQGLVTDTLTEQSMRFAEMGLTLKDIDAQLKDLRKEIVAAIKEAVEARTAAHAAIAQASADQITTEITAAVQQSAQDTALVLASSDSASFIDSGSNDPTSGLGGGYSSD